MFEVVGLLTKSEVNPPLTPPQPTPAPPRRGARRFEQASKNISPIKAGC
ncbi:MAG: hypothetical protein F6K25_30000 [Okeania sp. SIO2G4]|nr:MULTISPECIES: hypothetical protein [unclassified Okeania]NEP05200.1 hypothetical protein [Okeania sp. SIO4D6]NEP96973.1 hypothetical protein [Okeania sp. SIO2F5]NEQ94643.1 hypothetical protein [Okeania sp. SIO2G4]